jgi:hypothetical protein
MDQETARLEVREWLRAGASEAVIPQSVIFPRNQVGHLDVFEQTGFVCYRGRKAMPPISIVPVIGKALNWLDWLFQVYAPPVYALSSNSTGLINLPASQWLFGFNRRAESVLDRLGLHRLRIRRLVDGVNKAARQQKLIHIWAHPCEFRSEKDFDKLRYLLSAVAEQIERGRMQSVGMAELACWIRCRNHVTTIEPLPERDT